MSEFEKYDPKKTTEISHDDLADWIDLQAPHLTDEEIDHLIDGADVDGDGKINYKAYANLICNKILKMDSKPLQVKLTKNNGNLWFLGIRNIMICIIILSKK